MKVLITCPRLSLGGGVTNYYIALRRWLSIDYYLFQVGALKCQEIRLQKIMNLVADTQRFYNMISTNLSSYDLIHLNPSLDFKAIVRDGVFLKIAKNRGQKVLVMFHGWHERDMRIIEKRFFIPFFSIYNKADAFVVLASDFKKRMRKWGFMQPIYVETTPVDDALLNGFSIERRIKKFHSNSNSKIQLLLFDDIIAESDRYISDIITGLLADSIPL